ncbi:MAG: DUF2281 domain-containing protein [Thermodesulfovibrionales bacterium]
MKSLEEKIRDLPPELKQEVNDFIDFLMKKHIQKPEGKLRLDWAGALKDLSNKYTSVELQHRILDLWELSAVEATSSAEKKNVSD